MTAIQTVNDRYARARDIVALLAAMPTQQAQALRLAYFENLTDIETAARMGIALALARTATAAGLRNLGQALQAPNAAK